MFVFNPPAFLRWSGKWGGRGAVPPGGRASRFGARASSLRGRKSSQKARSFLLKVRGFSHKVRTAPLRGRDAGDGGRAQRGETGYFVPSFPLCPEQKGRSVKHLALMKVCLLFKRLPKGKRGEKHEDCELELLLWHEE